MTRTTKPKAQWTAKDLDELLLYYGKQQASPYSDKGYRELFDLVPLEEVRKLCLKNLNMNYDETSRWVLDRAENYLAINDYKTVTMLLREALHSRTSGVQRTLRILISAIHKILEGQYLCPDETKELFVILCGKLSREPEHYNKDIREFFMETLKRYDSASKYGRNEYSSRILQRVLRAIGEVQDTSFLAPLKEKEVSKEDLAHLMEYANISRETLTLEGLRLLVIRQLENISGDK